MTEAAHSPVGPSSLERVLACPGSVRATTGMPDTDSEFAIEGTAAHTLSEWCRTHDKPAKDFLGKSVPVKRVDGSVKMIEITPEMVGGVQDYIDYCNQFPGDPLIEVRVSCDRVAPQVWGTLDDARLSPGICYITDLKFGKGVQKYAKDNPQLLAYALGVYLDWDWLYEFKKFQLAIHQPRLDFIDEVTVSVEELKAWALNVLQPGIAATQQPNAPLKAGPGGGGHCQFCKIKSTCRERANAAIRATIGDFKSLDEAATKVERLPMAVEQAQNLGAPLMSNDELARVMDLADGAISYFKDVKAYAMREIQQGHKVGDWKLVEGRSKRGWRKDVPETEIVDALEESGVPEDDCFTKKIITPPKAEAFLGKKNFTKTVVSTLVFKPPGKPKLAPGSDPRPPMAAAALSEFADLGDDDDESE